VTEWKKISITQHLHRVERAGSENPARSHRESPGDGGPEARALREGKRRSRASAVRPSVLPSTGRDPAVLPGPAGTGRSTSGRRGRNEPKAACPAGVCNLFPANARRAEGLLITQNRLGRNDKRELTDGGTYSCPLEPFLSLPRSPVGQLGLPVQGSWLCPNPPACLAPSPLPALLRTPHVGASPSSPPRPAGMPGGWRGCGAARRSPKEPRIARDVQFTSRKTFCGGFIYTSTV